MTEIQIQAQKAVDALQQSVHDALEKKRRLGQYAVVWRDEKVVRLFEEEQGEKNGHNS